MPDFIVTAPTGQQFRVSAPEGATQEQALAYAQKQFSAPPAEPAKPAAEGVGAYLKRELAPAEIGKAAAATARDYLEGAVGLVALPVNAATELLNLATQRNDQTLSEILANALDKAGVPRNPNPYASAVNRAVGGGGVSMGAGTALAGAASPVVAGVGRVLASEPASQTAGAVTGATASQAAADLGAGPMGQVAVGALGGAAGAGALRAGAAEAVKRSFRGGEAGRQRVAENVQTFEEAGTTPSVGQATERRSMQAAESLLSRTPGAAGVMSRKATEQAVQSGANIERLSTQLAPKASGEQAGRAIQRGIAGEGGFIDRFKLTTKTNYDKLDQFVQPNTKFALPETSKALDELTKPIYGAEKTSNFFINSKIRSIKEALDADLLAGGNSMPYEAVKKLRSLVGEQLADAPFAGDVPRSQWKKLYAAMSSDLESNAKAIGPDAEKALARANAYHAAGLRRLDTVSSVIDKNGGPESVFRAAISGTKEGSSTLNAVMKSLPQDAQKIVSASVLRRLGRATAGRQDELGETFSTETFLTNWNTMSPEARAVLFNRYGGTFRQDMDQVAKVAANLREGSAVFRNPSGTAQAATQATTAATFAISLLTGRVDVAGGVAAGVGGANLSARLMTNPNFVKWLARTTKMPGAAFPAALNQLAQNARSTKDEDLKAAVDLMQQQPP